MRPDISDRDGRPQHLALHVHVPLLLIRRAPRLVVDALALRRERGDDRRERRRERRRDHRQVLTTDCVRRIEIVSGGVDARRDHVVKDAEPCPDRRPAIAERIVGDAEPGIEVPERRVTGKYRPDRCERGRPRRIHQGNSRRHCGIGGWRIPQSEVQRQLRGRPPLVLEVSREVVLAELAVGVVLPGQRAHDRRRLVLQEGLKARERPHAAPLERRVDIGREPIERAAEADAVASAAHIEVVRHRVPALEDVERIQLVRPDRRDVGRRRHRPVHSTREKRERGHRTGIVGQLSCSHEAEPHLIDYRRREQPPLLAHEVLVVRSVGRRPQGNIRSTERLEEIRRVGDIPRHQGILR